MWAKLHKFKDGCARLKPMKSLKVKIKDFWGCIAANAEKWIFDPLVWEWGSWDKSTYVHLQPWKEFVEECTRSFLACLRQVEEPSQYETHISVV